MRTLMLILVGILFISCKEDRNASHKKSAEEILNQGTWRLMESEEPFKRFQSGLKFSADQQVFNVDSQGQVVVPSHKRIYSIHDDTLKMVDYRYEERFVYSRGTDILLIKELNEDKMVLNALHPEGPNQLIFEHLN